MVGAKVAIAAKLKHHQAVQQWYDPCLDHHDQDNWIIAWPIVIFGTSWYLVDIWMYQYQTTSTMEFCHGWAERTIRERMMSCVSISKSEWQSESSDTVQKKWHRYANDLHMVGLPYLHRVIHMVMGWWVKVSNHLDVHQQSFQSLGLCIFSRLKAGNGANHRAAWHHPPRPVQDSCVWKNLKWCSRWTFCAHHRPRALALLAATHLSSTSRKHSWYIKLNCQNKCMYIYIYMFFL